MRCSFSVMVKSCRLLLSRCRIDTSHFTGENIGWGSNADATGADLFGMWPGEDSMLPGRQDELKRLIVFIVAQRITSVMAKVALTRPSWATIHRYNETMRRQAMPLLIMLIPSDSGRMGGNNGCRLRFAKLRFRWSAVHLQLCPWTGRR